MGSKENSKICILIVPHTKKVKRILIPQWFPKATITSLSIFLIFLLTYIVGISTYNLNLKQESLEKTYTINELQEENLNKEKELASLKSQTNELRQKTDEVQVKLAELDLLQRKLERMADMDRPSRGGIISRDVHLSTLSANDEMDVMKDLLEDKKLELEVFIEDFEDQLEYLECVPDLMPTDGRLTSKFGNRRDPFTRRIQFHNGIDIANSSGTKIRASAKGEVIFAGTNGAYGRTIIIDHGYGYKTLYAHNRKLLVSSGDKVEKGQVISQMGSTGRSTGSHLHFEIHINNKPIDPLSMLND